MKLDLNESLYAEIVDALQELQSRLEDSPSPWLLGGSCGLLLQGVKLDAPPRDIDIYVDKKDVLLVHELLTDIVLDEPRLDESGIYVSYLSHYRLGNLTMELVGGFEVRNEEAYYRTEVSTLLMEGATHSELEGLCVPLMPLSHELLFNILRGRQDRFLAIAEVMRGSLQQHLPLLLKLLKNNDVNIEMVNRLADLLEYTVLTEQWLRNRSCEI